MSEAQFSCASSTKYCLHSEHIFLPPTSWPGTYRSSDELSCYFVGAIRREVISIRSALGKPGVHNMRIIVRKTNISVYCAHEIAHKIY